MTVRRGRRRTPAHEDEAASPVGERPETLVGLMGQVVGNWSTTLRVVALLALLILGLWLLPVDLTLGPLEITKH